MKWPAVILTVIVTLTGTAFFISVARSQEAGTDSRKSQQEESAKRIKQLQNERLTTLREMAADMHTLYRQARAEAGQAHDAQRHLIKAEVELAETDADRIKLYENFVTVMKGFEEMATARLAGARGARPAILEAKAMRLEAEIALEQLKAAAAN